jgi:glutamate synthase (NADPH/NADH) small chain
MAAADMLNKAGHEVTLFEKSRKPGGLLRYGIPDFKLKKTVIDRRIKLMSDEGVIIKCSVDIGRDIQAKDLVNDFDAICIASGSLHPRNIEVEGRNLMGIHFAMDYLTQQNMVVDGETILPDFRLSAEGLRVVVLGGGDTGSDCVGTAIRQKAKSVTQIEILPKPTLERGPGNPWPYYGKTLKTSTSHEEGCERLWSLSTAMFTGENNKVTGLLVEDVVWRTENGRYVMETVPETRRVIEADMVILALGFVHPVLEGLVSELQLDLDNRKNIRINNNFQTSLGKVFAAGDAVSGASLVVNAIASGRRAARRIDMYLKSE